MSNVEFLKKCKRLTHDRLFYAKVKPSPQLA